MKRNTLITILLFLIMSISAQTTSYDIRLNQVGFLPNAKKVAAVIETQSDSFTVVTTTSQTVVFTGALLPTQYYSASEENVRIADFTMLTTPGNYEVVVADIGKSVPFSILDETYVDLSKASIKAFYYNRASMALDTEYAGVYARLMGHPDTAVVVHPSAASDKRPAGTVISTPKGWYDAGDYNKYIVNSGISTFTLLSAYETYPDYYDTLDLNIPESNNAIPDILDEALWNIEWMMTMQDPNDGGVYNKTTTAAFSGFVMPNKATATRYVAAKGTAATLDFAAIMAMTARIYKQYDGALADTALAQAKRAWKWAQENPDIEFSNPSASGSYPAISTGGYGDSSFDDEFSWCAAELFVTTHDTSYFSDINIDGSYSLPGWSGVKTLGLLSVINNQEDLPMSSELSQVSSTLVNLVDDAVSNTVTSPYRIPGDFYYWGGNSGYANYGMLLLQAYRLTGNASYFNAAQASLDYLLGRNATTYCFVTGVGTKNPMHIHHRVSGSDGITNPVPGFLVGGSNSGNMDDCGESYYESSLSAKAYADLQCSYSTNEVAINWNAPLVFLSGGIQAEYLNNFIDTMPVYLSVSTSGITLPSKAGTTYSFTIESNTQWSIQPSADWIELSNQEGSGSATIEVSSNLNNTDESARSGVIYIKTNNVISGSVTITQTGVTKSFVIQAEDYLDMYGLQTETTSDIGEGEDLGYVDADDWVTYALDISYEGVYNVVIRHAGYKGDFDVSLDDNYLKTITFDATSDWQDWESYSTQLSLTEGEHILKFTFNSAGTNLNWYSFDWAWNLSVSDNTSLMNVNVYPVPAKGEVTVELTGFNQQTNVQILTLDGRMVYSTVANINTTKIMIGNVPDGIYLIKIESDDQMFIRKVVFQK